MDKFLVQIEVEIDRLQSKCHKLTALAEDDPEVAEELRELRAEIGRLERYHKDHVK